MLRKIINKSIEILGLKYPVEFQLRRIPKKDGAMAQYWVFYDDGGKGKIHHHVIRIDPFQEDFRSIEVLLVHELCHAWQEENCPKSAEHGKMFQSTARMMTAVFSAEFPTIDWSGIYLKGTDE